MGVKRVHQGTGWILSRTSRGPVASTDGAAKVASPAAVLLAGSGATRPGAQALTSQCPVVLSAPRALGAFGLRLGRLVGCGMRCGPPPGWSD